MGFPTSVQRLADAIKPQVRPNQPRINSREQNAPRQNQGLTNCGRGSWHPAHGRGRARFNPTSHRQNPVSKECSDTPASNQSAGRIISEPIELLLEDSSQPHNARHLLPQCDVFQFLLKTIQFSMELSKIEQTFNSVFKKNDMDLNKFWFQFYSVVNLSDYKLKKNELSVLGKGLKFCPTPPKYCHGAMKESIDKFFRSASLKLFYLK